MTRAEDFSSALFVFTAYARVTIPPIRIPDIQSLSFGRAMAAKTLGVER